MDITGAANGQFIDCELAWLEAALQARLTGHFNDSPEAVDLPPAPSADVDDSAYAALIRDLGLGSDERLVLALAVAPQVAPELLDLLLMRNQKLDRHFSEFGGIAGQSHAGFLPTVDTALFLLAGGDLARRLALRPLVSASGRLMERGVLALNRPHPDEPPTAAALQLTDEFVGRLLTGDAATDADQPGLRRIETLLDWSDLVLDSGAMAELETVAHWIRHQTRLLSDWSLGDRVKPGYRCLFHGPPGTGKTLAACLLGKATGLEVVQVDLALIVSKYIGETEKALAAVFERAARNNWILFFDNSDALLGKRTGDAGGAVGADVQIAGLLARMTDYPGVAILSTDLAANLSSSALGRFEASIHFPMPDFAQRTQLWRKLFPPAVLVADLHFEALAANYELSGGAMTNVLRHACLLAARHDMPVTNELVEEAVQRELSKHRVDRTRQSGQARPRPAG